MKKKNTAAEGKSFVLRMAWQAGALLILACAIGLCTNLLRSDRLALPGDWSVQAQLKMPTGGSLGISLLEARTLFEQKKAVFLDARPPEEFQQGHIRGAHSLPPDMVDEYFEAISADIPEHAVIITYCDGETCHLSKELAQILLDMGYAEVRVLVNGWTLWQENSLPTEPSAGA